jgi:hypothetical protein
MLLVQDDEVIEALSTECVWIGYISTATSSATS